MSNCKRDDGNEKSKLRGSTVVCFWEMSFLVRLFEEFDGSLATTIQSNREHDFFFGGIKKMEV